MYAPLDYIIEIVEGNTILANIIVRTLSFTNGIAGSLVISAKHVIILLQQMHQGR